MSSLKIPRQHEPILSLCLMANSLSFTTIGFTTAGDAADGLLFGWEIATVQKWSLIYLGVSLLAFVVVWLVGAFRTRS
jgi:hypothetical protein